MIEPLPERGPLSFQQLRQWFLNRLRPDSTAYNMLLAIRLRGAVEEERLLAALEHVLWQHPILRTGYIEGVGGAEPSQATRHRAADLMAALDRPESLPRVGPHATDAAVATEVAALLNLPFDLADSTPPVRLGYYRLGGADTVIALCVHHIAFDAASGALVIEDLIRAYETLGGGGPPDQRQSAGYAEYARAQRAHWGGALVGQAAAFWRDELAGADLTPLAPRTPPASNVVNRYAFRLDPAASRRLAAFAARTGGSLFGLSLTAVLAWVSLYTGCQWPTVGVPVDCRSGLGTERLVGSFINTLLVGCPVYDSDTLIDVAERARRALARAMGHHDFPLEMVLRSLSRAGSRQPDDTPSVLLTVNPVGFRHVRLGEADVSLLATAPAAPQVHLSIVIQQGDEALEGWLDVRAGAIGSWMGAEVAGHLAHLLRLLAEDPGASIGGIEIMTRRERAGLHTIWNGTGTEYCDYERSVP